MGGDEGEGLKRELGRDRLGLMADKSGRSHVQPTPNDPLIVPHPSAENSLIISVVSRPDQEVAKIS